MTSAVLVLPRHVGTEPDDDRFEVIDGQRLERNMGSWAGAVEGKLFFLLYTFTLRGRIGRAFSSAVPFRLPNNHIRKPDVSFVAADRRPGDRLPDGPLPVAPDLAVEVISPSDLQYDVDRKVAEYLEVGVKLVWVINPDSRVVIIDRADGSIAGIREGGELDGEDAVPGFRRPVADLFVP